MKKTHEHMISRTATDSRSVLPIRGHIGSRSIQDIRGDFPILRRTVKKDIPLVYLDNAATTQKPETVIQAEDGYYRSMNANVHRGVHTLSEEATAAYEAAREKVRDFIGAKSSREIIFTRGTTESINLVAWAWGMKNLTEGDEILLSEMEHHSNLVPWQMIAAQRGAKLKFLPFREDGTLDLDSLDTLWSERTRLVSLVHMSNVFGTINPVKRVIEYAHQRNVPVLLDGAQSVPHMPVDVQQLDCDFLAFSGHKMYGPMGIGILYGKEELLEEMPPFMGGGEMIRSVRLESAVWNELPWKFEAGTPNVAGAIGLGAAVDYLDTLGMQELSRYEEELTGYAVQRLKSLPGLTLYGPQRSRGGVLSFTLEKLHPHDIAQFLDSRGIAIRAGHHCAHPVMRKLKIPATARASIACYTTPEEIDALAEAVTAAQEFFHGI